MKIAVFAIVVAAALLCATPTPAVAADGSVDGTVVSTTAAARVESTVSVDSPVLSDVEASAPPRPKAPAPAPSKAPAPPPPKPPAPAPSKDEELDHMSLDDLMSLL